MTHRKIEFHDSLGYICTSTHYKNVSEGIKTLTEQAKNGFIYVAGRGDVRINGKIKGYFVK